MLQASTPVAVTTFVLAHQFKTEIDFVASATVVTTLVSVVTLSLMSHFFA
jgi:predicted permease